MTQTRSGHEPWRILTQDGWEDRQGAFEAVPTGLRLWSVMFGDSPCREGSDDRTITRQVRANRSHGPICAIIQATDAVAAFHVLAQTPSADWVIRGVRDRDRWIAEHIAEIPPKTYPSIIFCLRKDP